MPKIGKTTAPKPGIYDMDRWAMYDQTDAIKEGTETNEELRAMVEESNAQIAELVTAIEGLTTKFDDLLEILKKVK